jgi:hypothetical protein
MAAIGNNGIMRHLLTEVLGVGDGRIAPHPEQLCGTAVCMA